jgi:hypothetical protein
VADRFKHFNKSNRIAFKLFKFTILAPALKTGEAFMDLYIAPSGIPGSGNGLFTKKDIKRGEVILVVTGIRLTPEQIEANYADSNYLLELNDESGDCMEVTGLARYANDAEGLIVVSGLKNNAEFCSDEDQSIYMCATRNIKAGSEIFTTYGENYWSVTAENLATAGVAGE